MHHCIILSIHYIISPSALHHLTVVSCPLQQARVGRLSCDDGVMGSGLLSDGQGLLSNGQEAVILAHHMCMMQSARPALVNKRTNEVKSNQFLC